MTAGERRGPDHRLFAAAWERIVQSEGRAEQNARRTVLEGVRGRVLELGAGLGANWAYVPESVDYVGTEPDRAMLRRAAKHQPVGRRRFNLVRARAERLPFPDESFDSAFGTLVFCTVEDLDAALRELRRVLKPGAEYRFWEHVRPQGRLPGTLFDVLTPGWKRAAVGCHLNRRTVEALGEAGFRLDGLERTRRVVIPEVVGCAVKPA